MDDINDADAQIVPADVHANAALQLFAHGGQMVVLNEVNQCQGVTKSGIRCKWTAASDDPAAAPLRIGGHYCFWHEPRRRLKPYRARPDPSQQKIDHFFYSQDSLPPSPARASSPAPIADGGAPHPSQELEGASQVATQGVPLTPDQRQRIAENRRRALERRAERQQHAATQDAEAADSQWQHSQITGDSQDMSQPFTQLSQVSNASMEIEPMKLSQVQLERIKQKRQEALEKRRHRQEEIASQSSAVPSQTTSVTTVAEAQDEDERSRTPRVRPRRQLVAMVTGSPPPLPLNLASQLPELRKLS